MDSTKGTYKSVGSDQDFDEEISLEIPRRQDLFAKQEPKETSRKTAPEVQADTQHNCMGGRGVFFQLVLCAIL